MITEKIQQVVMIVLGCLLVAAAAAAGVLAWQKHSLESKLEQCQSTNQALQAKIDEQNRAMVTLSERGVAARQETAQALEKLKVESDAHLAEQKRLRARILAPQHSDCGSAIREIREVLK